MADKPRDAETLERDIERSRTDLAWAIDALADRVSPARLARRGARRLRDGAASLAATVGGALRPFDVDSAAGAYRAGDANGAIGTGTAVPGEPPVPGEPLEPAGRREGPEGPEGPGEAEGSAVRSARSGPPPALVLAGAGVALAITAVAVVAINRRRRRRA
jgi:hypothetical protein